MTAVDGPGAPGPGLRRQFRRRVTSSVRLRVLVVLVSPLSAHCGLSGPSGNPEVSSFSGSAIVVESGVFSVDVEADFRKEGTLRAELNWTVAAPGSGRFGAQPPRLSLLLDRDCTMCDVVSKAGPANQGPLSLTGPVETSWRYLVRIVNSSLCGGCRIEYRLEVTHPEGSVRLRSPRTCPAFIVRTPCVQCPGVTTPVLDLQASPPRARMRVGERTLLDVREVGCAFTPPFHVESFSSTDPTIAEIQNNVYGDPTYLAALKPGQTRVLANVVHVDGSRVQAELGHCPGALDVCSPTRLTFEVVR